MTFWLIMNVAADSTAESVQRQQPPTVTLINVPQELRKEVFLHHTKAIVELSTDAWKRVSIIPYLCECRIKETIVHALLRIRESEIIKSNIILIISDIWISCLHLFNAPLTVLYTLQFLFSVNTLQELQRLFRWKTITTKSYIFLF